MADVLVAMSGGVDSSVAAALLVDAGHSVTGVTLKLWGGESDSGCCSVSDVDDARWVATALGIEHHVFNLGDDFNTHVVDRYVADYAAGLNPNPCIECNRHIKFAKLLDRADLLGFDQIATGHHAAITELDGSFYLTRGADRAKDQSYVLYMLGQAQLRRLQLPVGSMTKDDVRRIAEERGLVTAGKPDSQDVCFIHSKGGREQFLGNRIPLTKASVVNNAGATVGTVSAVELVTVGQRRGIDVGGNPDRQYVTAINRKSNVITMGDLADAHRPTVDVGNLVWASQPVVGPVSAQFSAHGPIARGHLDAAGLLTWDQPQIAVAPGQSVVFYHGDRVLGGGIAR
ncbi:MAG: tRNA 2-thiouridine(34) synthase MnmA [Acidimicrobiales bacterium]|nr:tRNA 2-thiouridine(34) synthase MnmA [Acidimicrobiales bacterium]